MLSTCGIDCAACPSLNKECQGGCRALQGRVFWTQQIGVELCQLYKCVTENKFNNCGECVKLPCDMWFSLKDPSLTEEQHKKSTTERVQRLKQK